MKASKTIPACCGLHHSIVLTPLLCQGGDLGSMTDANMPRLYLLQWLKSDRALMMLFNDGTFQVNTCPEFSSDNIPVGHKDHNQINPDRSFSKGQLLPRPHQNHPLLSERRVHADLHQRGPCLQNLQTQLLVDVGVPR